MVCMLSKGLNVSFGVDPAAKATIIVSPIAREIAKINDAITPERPAGRTILVATSKRVAPRAKPASFSDAGTAASASSLSDDTIGIIMIPTTSPALSALKTLKSGINVFKIGVTKVRAK
jgi:hypothetical protein